MTHIVYDNRMFGHNSVTHRRYWDMPFLIPAPHDPTLAELQGHSIDCDEYCESIRLYIAGITDHWLVAKFGWIKSTAINHRIRG
jgi:hypothetical protein